MDDSKESYLYWMFLFSVVILMIVVWARFTEISVMLQAERVGGVIESWRIDDVYVASSGGRFSDGASYQLRPVLEIRLNAKFRGASSNSCLVEGQRFVFGDGKVQTRPDLARALEALTAKRGVDVYVYWDPLLGTICMLHRKIETPLVFFCLVFVTLASYSGWRLFCKGSTHAAH